jgi:hypothetical protein
MAMFVDFASGVGGGRGWMICTAATVVNNDDSDVATNISTMHLEYDVATAIDIVTTCLETGSSANPLTGEPVATEYFFTTTVQNLTAVRWDNFYFELGFGTGASFVQSSIQDFIDYDTTGALGTPEKTPTPTYSKAVDSFSHLGGILSYGFTGGTDSSIYPGETVTFTHSIDLSDGFSNPGAPVDRIPSGFRSTPNFFLTLRAYPAPFASVVEAAPAATRAWGWAA